VAYSSLDYNKLRLSGLEFEDIKCRRSFRRQHSAGENMRVKEKMKQQRTAENGKIVTLMFVFSETFLW
jgi:hypothetical protein